MFTLLPTEAPKPPTPPPYMNMLSSENQGQNEEASNISIACDSQKTSSSHADIHTIDDIISVLNGKVDDSTQFFIVTRSGATLSRVFKNMAESS